MVRLTIFCILTIASAVFASGSGSSSGSGSNSTSEPVPSSGPSESGPPPTELRSESSGFSDVDILNFALTLEFLEATFYKIGLRKFNVGHFRRAGFHNAKFVRDQFVHIGKDEATHVTALSGVIRQLGGRPVPPCDFDFRLVRRFEDFLAIARALEQTGVSAYDGAHALISDKTVLTAAATIATVESRHSSFLNIANNGIPVSESFDTALDGSAILALASPFIKRCSFDLGIRPNTPLIIVTKNIRGNTRLDIIARVDGRKINNRSDRIFCSFIHGGISVTVSGRDCRVPRDAQGFVYVFLTNSADALTASNKNSIIAGPALIFIDSGSHRHSRLL